MTESSESTGILATSKDVRKEEERTANREETISDTKTMPKDQRRRFTPTAAKAPTTIDGTIVETGMKIVSMGLAEIETTTEIVITTETATTEIEAKDGRKTEQKEMRKGNQRHRKWISTNTDSLLNLCLIEISLLISFAFRMNLLSHQNI